jgi:hypothetical protein
VSIGKTPCGRASILTVWEEPKELDTDNEAVISLYDGIKKILEKQASPKPNNPKLKQEARIPREAKHVLRCGRILKVDVERKLVVVTVMKTDGELHQLRIEANDD